MQLLPGPVDTTAGPGRRRVRARRWRDALADRDRGTSPIELAILLPVIVVAMFATIQVAVYFLARTEALAVAQEAVSAQRVYGAPTKAYSLGANALLNEGADGKWLQPAKDGKVDVVLVNSTDGTGFTVTVTGTAPSMIWRTAVKVTVVVHGTYEVKTPTPTISPSQPPPGPPVLTP
jgi:Flp pilus assembly protein TadG